MITRPSLLLLRAILLFSLSAVQLIAHESDTIAVPGAKRVLVFSGTGWYRHPEIPLVNGWLVRLGGANGFQVDVTETAKDVSAKRLASYQVLVMNNCTELAEA